MEAASQRGNTRMVGWPKRKRKDDGKGFIGGDEINMLSV